MNRPISFYIFFILIIPAIVIGVDPFFKFLIPTLNTLGSVTLITFGNIQNRGFMMGGFSNLSPFLRIGLSFMVGGIVGNVIDRAYFGYVRDFVSLIQGLYFNVADIFLGIGVVFTIFSLFKFKDVLWRSDCMRKGILINPKLQIAFSFKVTLIAFAFAVCENYLDVSVGY